MSDVTTSARSDPAFLDVLLRTVIPVVLFSRFSFLRSLRTPGGYRNFRVKAGRTIRPHLEPWLWWCTRKTSEVWASASDLGQTRRAPANARAQILSADGQGN